MRGHGLGAWRSVLYIAGILLPFHSAVARADDPAEREAYRQVQELEAELDAMLAESQTGLSTEQLAVKHNEFSGKVDRLGELRARAGQVYARERLAAAVPRVELTKPEPAPMQNVGVADPQKAWKLILRQARDPNATFDGAFKSFDHSSELLLLVAQADSREAERDAVARIAELKISDFRQVKHPKPSLPFLPQKRVSLTDKQLATKGIVRRAAILEIEKDPPREYVLNASAERQPTFAGANRVHIRVGPYRSEPRAASGWLPRMGE